MVPYKAASFLVLGWGIFMLAGAAVAGYFMGSAALSLLVIAAVAATLAFSVGHFLNRGRKQAFIMALATGITLVLLLGGLTSAAFSGNPIPIDLMADAWASSPRDVSLLVSSAMFIATVCLLVSLLIFAKSIYQSFPKKQAQH